MPAPRPAARRRFLAGGAIAAATAVRAAVTTSAAGPIGRAAGAAEPASRHVIDTHTHFYDPSRPAGVPWPSPDDTVLHRTVLPAEWETLVRPLGVTGTIVVEASSWVEDNQWLLDLAAAERRRRAAGMLGIVGVVGNLPVGEAGCADLIARFARDPLYRGIRVNGDKLLAGLAGGPYAADLARVADHDLAVDVNHGRVLEAVDLVAQRLPRLRIVVDHMAGARISPAGPEAAWRDGIRRVAAHGNVFMKVSALAELAAGAAGPAGPPTDSAFYTPWLETVWEAFGAPRLLFGSNWPVSNRATGYANVLGIVTPFVRAAGPAAERSFFHDASQAAYRWVAPD